MTVIFKHLRGRGDSPSSRPMNQGMASGKALTVEGCVTSSIFALSAGDQGLYTPGEQSSDCSETKRKGRREGPG